MKYFKVCISSLILLTSASLASATELSLNQSRFMPGDYLNLTLAENWSGKADVYIAVSLPADDTLFFLTQQGFVLNLVPFVEAATASPSREIFQMMLPAAGLPTGEYTFYAAAMRSESFFDVLGVTSISFIFATQSEPIELTFGDIRFPDGLIGRSYSFAIEPETGTPPYQFSLSSGALPYGLTLGSNSGLIQGEPTERGISQFTVQVVDASGNVGYVGGDIRVLGILNFGEHGTYKGCNGLQMALNLAQDLDEIRIEKGTYECNGLEISSGKSFEHGIKISGGWDSGFVNQSDDPAVTIFDGKEKGTILSISAGGGSAVAIEGLSFQNGHTSSGDRGGAIISNGKDGKVNITNCVFTKNSGSYGGAVSFEENDSSSITNSTFTNNSASDGGAVYFSYSPFSSITNSTFTNNKADDDGGAVYSYNSSFFSITNSTFTNNKADDDGGAVYSYNSSSSSITNSIFTDNSASSVGGAVVYSTSSSSSITNSTFTDNSASYDGGAVYFESSYDDDSSSITNSTFANNSASRNGGAVYFYYSSSITNSTIVNNSASENGGGFYGTGTILNTIFAENKLGVSVSDITPSDEDLHVDYTLVNNISGGVNLGTHIIMGDPGFVDAENGNFRLRSNSPAIDMGDSSLVEYYPFLKDDNGNALDLDGNPRIVGGAIDLGAYEVQ